MATLLNHTVESYKSIIIFLAHIIRSRKLFPDRKYEICYEYFTHGMYIKVLHICRKMENYGDVSRYVCRSFQSDQLPHGDVMLWSLPLFVSWRCNALDREALE